MEPTHHHLKLCTFEVCTHLGRHRRLGAHKEGRVLDLNFATAWYLAQTGEPDPHLLAGALVPPTMMGYLRSGLRASHTAEELFLGSGPRPAEWWRAEPPPQGPNGETLVYGDSSVRLLDIFGREWELPGPAACEWQLPLVAAAGPGGAPMPGGYTILVRSGGHELAGPYLVTPNQIRQPAEIHWLARINGKECAQGDAALAFDLDNTRLSPGEFRSTLVLGSAALRSGDTFEVEAERIGVLRARVR
ncbi:MAG TPA: hypothetical protein VKV17_06315 [Bryobacteraceae bacterium]|nr:hypothetical protein [Bryobacteraceae bacterium]